MATLVGRSAELARLRALLDDATSGAVAALIGGDAGVGKSRLVTEVTGIAEERIWNFITSGEIDTASFDDPQVRDFVHFHVDPVGFDCAIFNFADNMLVAGAIALMLLALRPEPTEQAAGAPEGLAASVPSPELH